MSFNFKNPARFLCNEFCTENGMILNESFFDTVGSIFRYWEQCCCILQSIHRCFSSSRVEVNEGGIDDEEKMRTPGASRTPSNYNYNLLQCFNGTSISPGVYGKIVDDYPIALQSPSLDFTSSSSSCASRNDRKYCFSLIHSSHHVGISWCIHLQPSSDTLPFRKLRASNMLSRNWISRLMIEVLNRSSGSVFDKCCDIYGKDFFRLLEKFGS